VDASQKSPEVIKLKAKLARAIRYSTGYI